MLTSKLLYILLLGWAMLLPASIVIYDMFWADKPIREYPQAITTGREKCIQYRLRYGILISQIVVYIVGVW